MKKVNEELEKKALDFVNTTFTTYSNRKGLDDIWEKSDKIYNLVSSTRYYQGTADLFPPETRKACITVGNFADETMFNADPPFRIKSKPASKKKAEALTTTIDWQQQKINLRAKVRDAFNSLVRYGTLIVKVHWLLKEKQIVKDSKLRDFINKLVGGKAKKGDKEIKKETIATYDNVAFEVKSLRSIFFNPFQNWEDQNIIIERSQVTYSYLKRKEKQGMYYNVERLKEEGDQKDATSEKIPLEDVVFPHIKDLTGLTSTFSTTKDNHELLEAWCNFDIDDDGEDEECLIVVVDRKYVIRLELNPYEIQEKPYLHCVWDKIDGTCLGQGIPQLCERSQIALNDFTNQIMDNITFILNNMWVVDELAEIAEGQLKSRPNGVIKSKTGIEGIRALEKQLTANEGLKAVAMSKEDIRQVSGATVSLQGMPSRYGTTATESQGQATSSARDIFAKIRDFEDNIVKQFLRKTYGYDLQFMSREDFINIVGEEAAEALIGKPEAEMKTIEFAEMIQGDYEFIPLGMTHLENKVVKVQQLINFLNIAGKLPPGLVDISIVIARIWKYLGDETEGVILPQPKAVLLAPEDENILISQGTVVIANPMDNHNRHLYIHAELQVQPELELLKQNHINQHNTILEKWKQQMSGALAPVQEQPRIAPTELSEQEMEVVQPRA